MSDLWFVFVILLVGNFRNHNALPTWNHMPFFSNHNVLNFRCDQNAVGEVFLGRCAARDFLRLQILRWKQQHGKASSWPHCPHSHWRSNQCKSLDSSLISALAFQMAAWSNFTMKLKESFIKKPSPGCLHPDRTYKPLGPLQWATLLGMVSLSLIFIFMFFVVYQISIAFNWFMRVWPRNFCSCSRERKMTSKRRAFLRA